MRLRILAAAAALALSSCAGLAPPASPGAIAGRTTLDEKAGDGFTVGYRAANRLGLLAIRFGVAKGDTARRIKALDDEAVRLVIVVRQAYLAGNAASYGEAIKRGNAIVEQITNLSQ